MPQWYQSMEPVSLALATDLHVLAPTLTDGGAAFTQLVEQADGKFMPRIDEILDAFCADVAEGKPDILILSGDLTFNGETESHRYLADALRDVERAGVQVLVLPGNHDLDSIMSVRFAGDDYAAVDSPDAAQFAEIYADFGYSQALARDSVSLSYVYEVSPGLRLLLVDTNTAENPGAVLPETLRWIEQQLKAAREVGARVIAVSHQTILQHNSRFLDGFAVTNREALLSLYRKYHVSLNLCGHMHIQHVCEAGGLTEIVTSALSVGPCQYGLLEVNERGGSYETRVAVPQTLSDAAADFFTRNSLRQARGADADMAAYLAALNSAYFSGRMDLASREDALLARWRETDAFTADYLESLLADQGVDFTRASFIF